MGCAGSDQACGGGQCTFVVSTGILLISVDQKLVDTSNNTFRNNDANLVNLSSH